MTWIISSILIINIFISCNSETHKTEIQHTTNYLLKSKPFLHGVWVPEDYINELEETKSPVRSSEKLNFISTFIIDTLFSSTDSVHVQSSIGNHEGYDFILYNKQGRASTSLKTNIEDFDDGGQYELGYNVSKHDTTLILYHYADAKKLIRKTVYVKVSEVNPYQSLENSFQYWVNKKLTSGTFSAIEINENKINVELNGDGSIKGLPGFETYYIITDFESDDENKYDKICFNIRTANQKCYRFKIEGDTINIYNQGDKKFSLESLVYKFIRQR